MRGFTPKTGSFSKTGPEVDYHGASASLIEVPAGAGKPLAFASWPSFTLFIDVH